MFERMEEGDFSLTYDVHGDSRPDNVTLVGRAYNRMRAQLATIVSTDPLSGCLNRRGFEQQLARDVRRAARSNGEIALIAVDLDHFKLVNDSYGHLAGDIVIEEAGALLRQTARGGDVVGRIGGEEFVILAPETGLEGATHVAERVVEAFREHRFRGVGGKRPVTVSVGVVADRPRDEHAASDLRARADEALYVAKRAGRDRMVVWGDAARLTGEWAVRGLMTTGAYRIDGTGAPEIADR
jgi:diguanylate cyclase (GGDEF)-like protein